MSNRIRLGCLALVVLGATLLSACGGGTAATPISNVATAIPTIASGAATSVATSVSQAETAVSGAATALPTTIAQAGTAIASVVQGGATGEVKIGFAFVTSGAAAVYGNSQKAAAQLAVDELNAAGQGPKITAVFEDTAGQPNQAVTVFQKFINTDQVDAIIGPTLSNEALSSDPVAQNAKVPVLGVSNTASGITDIGDYIFRDSLAEAQVIPETIKEAKSKLNLNKVVLMYAQDDAFSKSGADVFRTELQKNNIQILSEETFSTNDTDFRTQLTKAKGENPDALVVSALIKPAQLLVQQARNDVGIDPAVRIIGGNGFNSPALMQVAGSAAEGVIVGAAWNPNATDQLSQNFINAYKQANGGKTPDQFAAQAYAGVNIMYDAIKRANIQGKSLADARTAIRDALKGTSNLPTVLGSFSFTDARDANHQPVVQVVKNGKFEILK